MIEETIMRYARLKDRLAAGETIILDGPTGTELQRRGAPMDPAAWCGPATLDNDRLLTEIHADYIRAGADVITANTFASSRLVLAKAGLADRVSEISLCHHRAPGPGPTRRRRLELAQGLYPTRRSANRAAIAPSYHRNRFPSVVIQRAVWLYLRFTLSIGTSKISFAFVSMPALHSAMNASSAGVRGGAALALVTAILWWVDWVSNLG